MAIASNSFVLYKDNNTSSKSSAFNLADFRSGVVQSISGTFMQDAATVCRFNLPVGVVVTLMEHNKTIALPDFKSAGRTYDLIGTGKEMAVNLGDFGMNDCVSAFVWRDVDVSKGYVTLFEHAECKGVRQTLFLDEWEPEKLQSLKDWFIHDLVSSIAWKDVLDTLYVDVFEHVDGTGKAYRNIKGGTGTISNLKSVGFNDLASSFLISRLKPVKEAIQSVTIGDIVPKDESDTTLAAAGSVNSTSAEGNITCAYQESITETASVTVTDTHSAGGALEMSYTWEAPLGGSSASATLTLSYNYEHSESSTTTTEKTISLSVSEQYTVPPMASWSYSWLARSGDVDIPFETKATRWYDTQLSGCVPDGNLYKRDEIINGTFKGAMFLQTISAFETTPLG